MALRNRPKPVHISPSLLLHTFRELAKKNAELVEEVKQLRAAVNVYRELAGWNPRHEKAC